MSNKFTQKAQLALQCAMSTAREMGHTYIGSEHLLLGLLSDENSIAARLLVAKGVSIEGLRKTVIEIAGFGAPSSLSPDDMTPRLRRIIEGAATESLRCGARYLGTEHLLLALLSERDSVGVRLLEADGISSSELKKDVVLYLETTAEQEKKSIVGKTASEEKLKIRGAPTLSAYGRDLTEQARAGLIDPVIGRDRETDRVIRILSRRTKNNPCLVGEPGVGKTAVVEGLARRIAEGSVPETLRDRRIVTLDISSMIAGAKYRGEFEERMKKVMEEAAKNPDLILFIDELHVIIGAGAAEGAVDAANILKPALARAELQIIGATTLSEYRAHIERDAALERRFQSVLVEEPTAEGCIEILRGLRERYESHHGIRISDEAIDAAVRLSIRYLPDRFLPDKAIDLVDEASSAVRILAASGASPLHALEEELSALRAKKEEAVLSQAFEEAASLRDREQVLLGELAGLHDEDIFPLPPMPTLRPEDIADALTAWTGIPLDRLLADESRKLLHLEENLSRAVIGQETAVRVLSQTVRRGRMGLGNPHRPIGSLIFLGQTGVGKSKLAGALALELFGSESAMIRLDMSEYMEKHSVSRLVGAPPGYVGYGEGGQLTEKIRRRPYSVLLLDEIEKAHPDVFHLLLQVLEDGVLTDSQGRRVDFSHTVIIMTSNLGTGGEASPKILGFSENDAADRKQEKERMLSALRERFRPEFLNRVDEVILFEPLGKEELARIAEKMLLEVQSRAAQIGVTLSFAPDVAQLLTEQSIRTEYGARPLRREIVKKIENPLSEKLLSGEICSGDEVLVSVLEGEISFLKDTSPIPT
ncbi:MAG: ATP-dependent Clp protease ATP-binding subunit [Clostridia bacterium]|nr:ATP-dependent Clp protease ATP-binding subunit [Clostridia bacterium]